MIDWRGLTQLKIDGRWFLTGNHLLLVILSKFFFHLQRSWLQIAIGLAAAVIAELAFYFFTSKYPSGRVRDRVFSALAEGAGLLVLLKSHIWWFYALASLLAVGSKYLLRRNSSSHVFNPTCFAIVASLALLPSNWFGAWSDEYMIRAFPMAQVTLLGIFAATYGRSLTICVGYLLGLAVFGLVFWPVHSLSDVIYVFGPEIGTAGLIFLFLMITDPKTTPRTAKAQMIFGFSVAALHLLMRHSEVLYSRYISLFAACIVFALIKERVWQRKPALEVLALPLR